MSISLIGSHKSQGPSGIEPLVKLWLLRLLVPLECQRKFIGKRGFDSDELANLLGLSTESDDNDEAFDAQQARAQLKRCYEEAESNVARIPLPQPLAANIQKLAEHISMTPVDCGILMFAVLIRGSRLLDDTSDWLGRDINSLKVYHALSILLGFPESEIRKALSAKSVLSETSLVVLDRRCNELGRKLDLLSDNFADRLMVENGSPVDWLKDTVIPSKQAELSLGDYPHIQDSLDFLLPYLFKASDSGRRGVNILFHGMPGTGKTQLTRVLANQLNCPLYEIASEDEDGDPVDGERRLRAFRAAQAFFQHNPTLMLFDEVEDIFNDGNNFFGTKSTAQTRKAWMNRLLEENPIPTFWLGNSIDSIDPAFIRRFDWVIELPVPPKAQREQIIRNSCGNVLTDRAITRLAACEELAPAVVTRAAEVISTLSGQFPVERLSDTLQKMIDKTLIAQGHPGLNRENALRLPDLYDPEFLNCDADLKALAEGIQQHGSARLCLYGPPGTGKTAYSRWLAEQLNKPLHTKRGTDLLSKWVGGTEKNIARVFRDAEQDNAVLLIDEVDSFLHDRNSSQHSWEVSAVNEMLTFMESYNGVFIASTNRLESIDGAALRRFDLKVKFDTLKPKQAWKLLQSYCQALALPEPDIELQRVLEKMHELTPGDFAVVSRQHKFRPIIDIQALMAILQKECTLKTSYQRQAIGFY